MNAGHFSESHVSSGDLNRSPESRGSQTSGVLLVLFVQAKRIKPFPFGKFEVLRTSNQRTKLQFHTSPIKSFCRPCLLETWSPCSRPFAILPVSAVSDAQKLATGNFLHVRAAFSRRQSRLSRPRRLPQARHNRRSFHQALPEQPCKPPDSCLAPRHESPARHTAKANPDTGQKHCRWQSPRD